MFNPARRLLRGQAYLLLAGMLLLFGDELALKHFSRYAYGAPKRPKDQRTEVVKLDLCACEAPELVAKIEGREYPARSSDSFGAAAALYLAQCQLCAARTSCPGGGSFPQRPTVRRRRHERPRSRPVKTSDSNTGFLGRSYSDP